jgi:hypothetical protein
VIEPWLICSPPVRIWRNRGDHPTWEKTLRGSQQKWWTLPSELDKLREELERRRPKLDVLRKGLARSAREVAKETEITALSGHKLIVCRSASKWRKSSGHTKRR